MDGGTTVTVIGEGFLSGATVTLGGVPLKNLTLISDRMLRGTSGAHAAGLVELVVSHSLNGRSRRRPAAFASGGANPGLPSPGPFVGTMPLNVSSAGGVPVRAVVPGVQAGGAVLFGGYPGRVLEIHPATLPVTDWWKSFTYGSHAPPHPPTTTPPGKVTVRVTNPDGQSAVYRLEVSNAFGQVESAPARLEVVQNQPSPGVWAARDLGSVGTAGQVTFDAGAFVIEANGTNIAGIRDAFRFVCQPLIGDGGDSGAHLAVAPHRS